MMCRNVSKMPNAGQGGAPVLKKSFLKWEVLTVHGVSIHHNLRNVMNK